MNLRHALGKVHAVILNRRNPDIRAGRQRIVFLRNLLTACHLAESGNILIFSLAKLFKKPLCRLNNIQTFPYRLLVAINYGLHFFNIPMNLCRPPSSSALQ